jgi:hypothetical protein
MITTDFEYGKELRAREGKPHLETGQGKKMNSVLELPEKKCSPVKLIFQKFCFIRIYSLYR